MAAAVVTIVTESVLNFPCSNHWAAPFSSVGFKLTCCLTAQHTQLGKRHCSSVSSGQTILRVHGQSTGLQAGRVTLQLSVGLGGKSLSIFALVCHLQKIMALV